MSINNKIASFLFQDDWSDTIEYKKHKEKVKKIETSAYMKKPQAVDEIINDLKEKIKIGEDISCEWLQILLQKHPILTKQLIINEFKKFFDGLKTIPTAPEVTAKVDLISSMASQLSKEREDINKKTKQLEIQMKKYEVLKQNIAGLEKQKATQMKELNSIKSEVNRQKRLLQNSANTLIPEVTLNLNIDQLIPKLEKLDINVVNALMIHMDDIKVIIQKEMLRRV
jgi:hypothetical protein